VAGAAAAATGQALKAADFAYAKASSVGDALEMLARPGARVLAGGQSLIPSLNMRLSSPELLVDITGLKALAGISVQNDRVRIGALATHAQIGRSPEVRRHVPLLAQAVPHVAHAAIRNRGSIGGSLALADPAAEYPAVAVALEATLFILGPGGERRVKAEGFFKGLFETDLKPGELLTSVEFPVASPSDRSAFLELARRHGDYAIIGVAAHNARFVFFGAGDKPILIKGSTKREAKENLLKGLQPSADLYHSAAAKRHLAGVLLERAWTMLST
jgi:carbon-monoxide dehydrogenase medium subunit